MNIFIENRQSKINVDNKINETIYKVINQALLFEEISIEAEISIIFVDNEEIKNLNKEFRGIDRETDVLSFPQYENIDEIRNTEFELILGDIVISIEKAQEQSEDYGHTFEREIAFLTAHSMYHLFGYDHDTEENKSAMRKKEEKVLSELGILR